MQWAWDMLNSYLKPISVSGQRTCRTSRGFYAIGGSGRSSLSAITLAVIDVLPDYLVCRPLPQPPAPIDDDDTTPTPHWVGSRSADPVSPETGDAYYNTTSKKWRIFTSGGWKDMTWGDDKYFVAKEYLHRTSILRETILGTVYNYTYSGGPSETWATNGSFGGTSTRYNKTRTSDDGATTEDQRIVPPWEENEIILAVQAQTGVVHGDAIPVTLHIAGRSCVWAVKTT